MVDEKNKGTVVESSEGATLIEYALLAALIAVVCIVGITLIGQNASQSFSQLGSATTQN